MALVRHERILFHPDTVNEYPDYIETWNHQGGEGESCRIVQECIPGRCIYREFDTEETQHDAYGQAAGISHKDFPAVFRIPENIVVKERDEYS